MFLENEHQPTIISHSLQQYDLARPGLDHHNHNNLHQTTTINHLQPAADLHHQDDSEGRSTASSPSSSYRDLSGCEDFDHLKIPKPTGGGGSVTGGSGGGVNGNNNKEQKPKKHKCKHCGLECTEKVQYWQHIRTHIKPEQLLECPNCEFATDLKHHYEYHLLNHTGAKPFTCPDCDYKCVSKSMLQSHLKSHSNVFQFQCYDCGYASKYMHSLKQHLKKRDHRPATPLNPDGTPNPDIVIDVVGNRRGPRQNKKQNRHNPYHHHHQQQHQHQQQQQQQQHQQQSITHVSSSQEDGGGSSSGGHPSPYSMQQLLQMPAPGSAAPVYPTSAETFMYSMITKRTMDNMVDYQTEYMAMKHNNNNNHINNNSTSIDDKMQDLQQRVHRYHQYHPEDVQVKVEVTSGDWTPEPVAAVEPQPAATAAPAAAVALLRVAADTGPLNLSKDSVTPRAAGSSRRKGIACKLERPTPPQPPVAVASAEPARPAVVVAPPPPQTTDDWLYESSSSGKTTDEPAATTAKTTTTTPPQQQQQQQQPAGKDEQLYLLQQQQSLSSPEKDDDTHVCHHCDIIFKENIMYSMHMGFHSFRDPFACNLCGEITADKFSFFAHIARVPHS